MAKAPSPNGSNGDRDVRGRFVKGNPGGPGNPAAKAVAELRLALLQAVKPSELRQVVRSLVTMAKGGDLAAVKLLLERLLGPPLAADVEERLTKLEELAQGGK